MTDIAIRAEHLSKLYPALSPGQAIGRAQQRHDTTSTGCILSLAEGPSAGLRDALTSAFRLHPSAFRRQPSLSPDSEPPFER